MADTQTQKTDVDGHAAGTVRELLQFIHMCVLRLPSDPYSQNLAILQQCQFYDGTQALVRTSTASVGTFGP